MNLDSPDLHLLSSWDNRHYLPCLTLRSAFKLIILVEFGDGTVQRPGITFCPVDSGVEDRPVLDAFSQARAVSRQ
jgi:hypothetical protein